MMKKLVSLTIVLILVVCMATTAFAAAPADQYPNVVNGQCSVDPAKGKAFIILEPNAVVTVNVPNGNGSTVTAYGYHGDDFIEGGYNLIISKTNQIQSDAKGNAFGKMVGNSFVLQNLTGDDAYVIVAIDTTGSAPVVGTWDKPDALKIGSNTAKIKAESDGYYYTWTATEAGDLTITMPSGQWAYAINNVTTSNYSSLHKSTDRPIKRSETITVRAGDVIQVMVNTLNPSNEWQNPAGNITFTMAFGKTQHVHAANKVAAVTPDCITSGNIEYWYCSGCGGYWKDAALTKTADSASVNLPTTEHKFVGGSCTVCGEEEPKEDVTTPTVPGGDDTDATTPTAPGGNNSDNEATTPTVPGGDNSPGTGDMGIVSAVATMLASAMGATALISKKKKF